MRSTRDQDILARMRGFTIIELMLGIAILGVLVGIAYPSYQQYTERVRIAQAIIDIQGIKRQGVFARQPGISGRPERDRQGR